MSKVKQSGAILLTTLFITAIITLIAASIAFKEHLFITSSDGITHWESSYQNWQVLSYTISEKLSQKMATAPISYFKNIHKDMSINGQTFNVDVTDAQGRYNVNLLLDPTFIPSFAKLLTLVKSSLNTDLAHQFSQQLFYWLSPANPSDSFYLHLKPPYYPTHHAISNSSEVTLVIGYSKLKIPWPLLNPSLITLPALTDINRYDASPIILAALVPGWNLDEATQYHDCIKSSDPLSCDTEYLSSSVPNGTVNQTHYFLIKATLERYNQPPLYFSSLVHIEPAHSQLPIQIVWQRFSEN